MGLSGYSPLAYQRPESSHFDSMSIPMLKDARLTVSGDRIGREFQVVNRLSVASGRQSAR